MKLATLSRKKHPILLILSLVLGLVFTSCENTPDPLDNVPQPTEIATSPENPLWHVKAVHPDGRLIDIKALDEDGNIYDIKAIADVGQRQFLDIKALVDGNPIPVKILVSDDQYSPVKAILSDGKILDIKALDGDTRLDVKGVRRSGNVIHIKAIAANGDFYGIKALSPDGMLNDVKGIKTSDDDTEMTIQGVAIHAHVKALPQDGVLGDQARWHIKAVHPEGRLIDIKAIDDQGNILDVKAVQDGDQRQMMDIKAFRGDEKLPIKMLPQENGIYPVKAIDPSGKIYDIKAMDGETRLDVKGVVRSGNIIDIKAISSDGTHYGVKAFSPDGQLNDVKGLKMGEGDIEATIYGIGVFAHVKALPQL